MMDDARTNPTNMAWALDPPNEGPICVGQNLNFGGGQGPPTSLKSAHNIKLY